MYPSYFFLNIVTSLYSESRTTINITKFEKDPQANTHPMINLNKVISESP